MENAADDDLGLGHLAVKDVLVNPEGATARK
jgi:hypothetical protein